MLLPAGPARSRVREHISVHWQQQRSRYDVRCLHCCRPSHGRVQLRLEPCRARPYLRDHLNLDSPGERPRGGALVRRLWLFLIPLAFIVLTPSHARAQQGNTVIIRFAGAPSGSCSPVSIAVNNATGDFYDCKAAVWTLVGPAGGAHALIINGGGWLDLSGVGQLPPGGGDGSTVLLYADVDASVGYNALFHTLTRPSTSFTFVSTQTSDATNIGATAGGFYDFITFDPVNHLVTIQPDSSGIAKSTTPFQVNNHLQFEPGDSSIGRIAANSLTIGNGTAADFSGTLKLTTLTSVGSVSGA